VTRCPAGLVDEYPVLSVFDDAQGGQHLSASSPRRSVIDFDNLTALQLASRPPLDPIIDAYLFGVDEAFDLPSAELSDIGDNEAIQAFRQGGGRDQEAQGLHGSPRRDG
jgi:hypothetical protein